MTRLHPNTTLSAVFAAGGDMGRLMAQADWQRTPLGRPGSWPQSLRSAVSICLTSRFPMIIFWGPELAQLYNDAYVPILGSKHPMSLGQRAQDCWHELWPVIGPMLENVLHRSEATYSEDLLLLMERHGYLEEAYFTFSYSPISAETGGTSGVFCAVTETTERVLSERRLDTLRALGARTTEVRSTVDACRLAAEAITLHPVDLPYAAFYLIDPDGQAARLAATTTVPAGGPLAPEVVPLDPGLAPSCRYLDAIRRALVDNRPTEVEIGELTADADVAWPVQAPTHALVLPLAQAGAPGPAGLMVAGINPRRAVDDDYRAFFDLVSGQVAAAVSDAEAYEAQRRRAEALTEIDRVKTEFFANVSHEFRTPLTLLLGPLEDVLADGEALAPQARPLIEVAHRNGLRLLKLVNTLLDFARLEAGRVSAQFHPVDLAAETEGLASSFRAAIERAGLRLVVDCPPLPWPVTVDREMWEKIVLNVLSNAVKFTFEGDIEVRLRAVGDEVELAVRDTGVGIPAEHLPLLFERFGRVPGTISRTHEGTGIGLSLVRELTRLHGGEVSVASAPGVGSTFTVRIPATMIGLDGLVPAGPALASTRLSAEPYVTEALRWLPDGDEPVPSAPAAPQPPAPTVAPVVLVVDDNADMRAYLHRVLSAHWPVATAANGEEALRKIAAQRPEVVLSDVMMPIVDGFELLRRLRSDEATRDLPVIMLSARAGPEAAVEGLGAGADDYLVKPFTANELVARVRSQLQTERLRRRYTAQLRRIVDAEYALTESVPSGETGGVLAELLLAEDADWCAIWLVHPYLVSDTAVGLHLAAAVDPELAMLLHDEPKLSALLDVERVIGEGRPRTVTASRVTWPGELRPLVSDMIVTLPLVARAATFGAVTVALPAGAADNLPYIEDLVRRGAFVLDNARLLQAERRAAVSLQRSLLPRRLPEVPGATVTARYFPGAEGAEAGGDWYDVIELPDGRVGLSVGDVMGRGIPAATLMGQLRSALRGYALEGMSPATVLARMDAFLATLDTGQLTTCIYAVYDPATRRLCLASAGHPAPLLIEPGPDRATAPERGLAARYLPIDTGLALGLGVGPVGAADLTVTLPPGSVLLMFTDGLVETRERDLLAGLSLLRGAFVRPNGAPGTGPNGAPGTGPDEVCTRALEALGHAVDRNEAGGHDDVALLALRVN